MQKSKYNWKSDYSKMLRMLRNSRSLKVKHGWSRSVGAGFIKDDILNIYLVDKKMLVQTGNNKCPLCFPGATGDFNLRETEELIKWLENKIWLEKKP